MRGTNHLLKAISLYYYHMGIRISLCGFCGGHKYLGHTLWLISCSVSSDSFVTPWTIERGGEAKGREEKERQEVGGRKKTSIKQRCCRKSETHLFPFGAHVGF